MTVAEVLPVILYILGAILLTCLIVLTVKLIITMNKIEKVVDNITEKVSTLDKIFEIMGLITGKFTAITDKIVDVTAGVIEKVFNKRKDEIDE